MNFALMQYHKYSLTEVENMIPFEREVYTTFLMQYLEELKQKQEQAKAKQWQISQKQHQVTYPVLSLVRYLIV